MQTPGLAIKDYWVRACLGLLVCMQPSCPPCTCTQRGLGSSVELPAVTTTRVVWLVQRRCC